MTGTLPTIPRKLLLATAALFLVALMPARSEATLLGDPSVGGCVAVGLACPGTGNNLFSPTANNVDGTVEFAGSGEFPNDFNVSADLGTNAGVDFISIEIQNFGFALGTLTWMFSGLNWVGDPSAVISGVTQVSGPDAQSISFGDNSMTVQTAGVAAGGASGPSIVTLVFNLTAVPGQDDGDDEEVPGPAPLLLLLLGLPLVLLRRRLV